MAELDDTELEGLYAWIDEIPLSRSKRNMTRDFSDGVLFAEVIKYYMPRIVELHNYTPANSTKQKMEYWYLLNRKVFCKLQFELTDDVIRSISRCEPNIIERVLYMLRVKIDRALFEATKNKSRNSLNALNQHLSNEKPEADQGYPSPGRMPFVKSGPNGKGHPCALSMQSDFVSRVIFEEKEQECLAKDETVQILQAKIRRLEHLLHLKDIRIDDLQSQIDKMRPTGLKR